MKLHSLTLQTHSNGRGCAHFLETAISSFLGFFVFKKGGGGSDLIKEVARSLIFGQM